MNDRYLIVGLGNPGRKYRGNRHNIGFMIVDQLASDNGIQSSTVQNKAIVGDGRIANQRVILAKPQTYMNDSGNAVGPLANFYKVPPENIFVIYDELDLPFGTLRLREKGSAGGHNGMKSIIQHIGQDFPRLRVGIGRPAGKMPPAAWVLQDFGKDDMPIVTDIISEAIRATETYLRGGIQLAMSRHNGTVISDQ
jgi:PTH1 family peptidyl-tRNA hydrolase